MRVQESEGNVNESEQETFAERMRAVVAKLKKEKEIREGIVKAMPIECIAQALFILIERVEVLEGQVYALERRR